MAEAVAEVIAGVALAQYAAIQAALAEPFPLADVLAAEHLDESVWADADLAWTEQLVADAALLARYETELAAAEDRLTRAVEPLEGDVRAWVAFLAAMATAPSSGELLAQHGLGPNDLSRLRRGWDRRMKENPSLEKRAAELRKSPGRVPPVRAAEPALRPSGAKPPTPPEEAAEEPPAAPMEEKDAVRLREHRRFATRPGLGSEMPPPKGAPEVRVAEAHVEEVGVHDEATHVVALVGAPELPFRVTPSREFLEAMDAPIAGPGDGSDGETVSLDGDLSELELVEETGDPDSEDPLARLGTITSVTSPFADHPLPFEDDPRGQTVQMPAVPGDESEAPTRVMPVKKVIDALPADLLASLMADPETVPLDLEQLPVEDPLPFVTPVPPEPADEPTAPTEEIRGEMSLERHAALCLEIAVDPRRADEALARYRVTPAEKERADQLYKRMFTMDPSLRATWNRAFEAHRAALAARLK
jgi:hypothetical protein